MRREASLVLSVTKNFKAHRELKEHIQKRCKSGSNPVTAKLFINEMKIFLFKTSTSALSVPK